MNSRFLKKSLLVQVLLAFLILSIIHTWPLATNPSRLSRNDNADTQLNEWIVSWTAHRLTRDPLHLFDANIFYPERYTLAFSEPLIPPAVIGMPMRWLGASPVLTYNLLLLLGFTLTAAATYALIKRFTGDHLAGLLAGSLFAFNSHTLTSVPHLQAQYAFWLPLAILGFDNLIRKRRTSDGLMLALFMTLSAFTSIYLAVIMAAAMGLVFVSRAPDWWSYRPVSFILQIIVVAGLACAVVLFMLSPYFSVFESHQVIRPIEMVSVLSASPSSYLASAGRIHYSLWSRSFYQINSASLFPGMTAVVLCLVAFAGRSNLLSGRRLRMFLIIGAGGFLLSLGPATPVYTWLYRIFFPLQGLRAASRFGYLVLLSVAALAGYGLSTLRQRWGGKRWPTVLAVGLIFVANLEALRAPMGYTSFEGIPPIYQTLARTNEAMVVVEMPFPPPGLIPRNAAYMLASTVHWNPLLNGYSGFTPESYVRRAELLRDFPSEAAIAELERSGVTHVVVHLNNYPEEMVKELQAVLSSHRKFTLFADSQDGIKIYRLHQ